MSDFAWWDKIDMAYHRMVHPWLDHRYWNGTRSARCKCGKGWTA